MSNATVHLYPVPTSGGAVIIDETAQTGADGVAEFNFSEYFEPGQTGLLVLDIDVTGPGGLTGSGIMKIREEEVNEETVVIN